jgi:O-antigen/teichoic acid export membrane protein
MEENKKSIQKQIFTLFFSGAFAQVVNFLIGVFLNRDLPLNDRGSIGQLFLLFSFFSAPIISGVSASILYFLPKYKNQLDRYFIKQSNIILFILGLLLSLIFYLASSQISVLLNNYKLEEYLKIFSLYPLFKLLSSHYVNILVSFSKTRQAAIFSSIESLSYALSIIGARLVSDSIELLVIFIVLHSFIITIFVQHRLFLYTRNPVTRSIQISLLKEQLKYAGILGVTSSIGIWGWELDKLIVSQISSPKEYALYIAGATEVPFVNTLINSTSTVLIPVISYLYTNGKIKELLIEWRNAIKRNAIIVFPIFVFAFIYAENLIVLLYGIKYLGSTAYFKAYLFITPLRIISYGMISQAVGKTGVNLQGTLFFFTFNIILNFMLVPLLGPIGSSIATVISTILMAIFYLSKIKKILVTNLRDLLPFKNLILIMIIAIISIIPTALIFSEPNIWQLILGSLLYFSMYFILILLFKITNIREIRSFFRMDK